MVTKLMIDVDNDGNPVVSVTIPDGLKRENIDDVRDKLVLKLFSDLGHYSRFFGFCQDHNNGAHNNYIKPLSLKETMDILEEIIARDMCNSPKERENIRERFLEIQELVSVFMARLPK